MLDRFYDAMAAEVARAEGTVEKFAGDAVMEAFGVRTSRSEGQAGPYSPGRGQRLSDRNPRR